MPIVRTYRCDSCQNIFDVTCESNDPDPECPECEKVLEWQPGMFSVKTNRSRAMDLTQNIIEADYQLTNLQDNLREGDVAAKGPPPAQGEERAWREQIENDNRALAATVSYMAPQAREFFSGAGGAQQANVGAAAFADAKAHRAENAYAMDLFSQGGRKGEHVMTHRLLTEHGRTITVRK